MRAARRLVRGVAVLSLLLAAAGCGSGAPDDAAPGSTVAPPGATAPPGTTVDAGSGTTAARCPNDGAGSPGSGEHHLTVDGSDRTYLLTLPPATGTEPVPLIVQLHGHGGRAADLEARTRLGEQAAAQGFVVVTPDALGDPSRWNFDRRPDGPDDFAFVDALVTDLGDRLCLDPDRTYVAGSSNGAAFAGLLACTEPYRFAAVAMVIATVPSGCPDDVTPAVLTIRGTADARVPFDGTPAMVATYADRYGCDPRPIVEAPAEGIERTRFGGCRDGSEVVLDAVAGGPHAWPVDAGSTGAYQATDEILDLFARHRRGG